MKDSASGPLDFSMFTLDDFVNLVLQRSDVLGKDRASHDLVRAWEAGDAAPLYKRIEADPLKYAQAAADLIAAEYQRLAGLFERLRPRRIADIGCGYGLFDLYAYQGVGADLLLIDIETTEARHFGFEDEGAGYANLATARAFLEANGVPSERITTWNPSTEDLPEVAPADIAVSFLSCGFHYPIDMYLAFIHFGVTEQGAVILDLRGSMSQAGLAQLRSLGKVRVLHTSGGTKRVLLKKRTAA